MLATIGIPSLSSALPLMLKHSLWKSLDPSQRVPQNLRTLRILGDNVLASLSRAAVFDWEPESKLMKAAKSLTMAWYSNAGTTRLL